jgi:hypothetical protein
LEHSDLLVAVSDDVHGGPGGTSDVIAAAVDQRIPVIKISTSRAAICTLRRPDPDAARQEPLEGETVELQQQLPPGLAVELAHIVEPPAPSYARAHPPSARGPDGRERLEQYLREQFKPMWFAGLFRAFRDVLLYAARGNPVSMAAIFLRALRRYHIEPPAQRTAELSRSAASESSAAGESAEKLRRIHAARFAWADTLAICYADAVRSAYVAIGFLGFCGILVGVSALFVLQGMIHARLAALLVEGAIFLFLGVYFFRPAHAGRWHQRMTEYRALAEALGRQRFFHALGSAERSDRTAGGTWIDWYAKATRRELGFPTTMLSAAYLARMMAEFQRDEVEAQLMYNRAIAERYEAIDRFLSRCVQLGWMITVAAAILGVALLVTLHVVRQQQWIDGVLATRAIEYASSGFAAFMIIMPILVALVHGIRQQLDFLNTAERAAATERDLTDLAMRQRALQDTPGRRAILQYIRAANDAMTDERPAWARDRGRRAPELP